MIEGIGTIVLLTMFTLVLSRLFKRSGPVVMSPGKAKSTSTASGARSTSPGGTTPPDLSSPSLWGRIKTTVEEIEMDWILNFLKEYLLLLAVLGAINLLFGWITPEYYFPWITTRGAIILQLIFLLGVYLKRRDEKNVVAGGHVILWLCAIFFCVITYKAVTQKELPKVVDHKDGISTTNDVSSRKLSPFMKLPSPNSRGEKEKVEKLLEEAYPDKPEEVARYMDHGKQESGFNQSDAVGQCLEYKEGDGTTSRGFFMINSVHDPALKKLKIDPCRSLEDQVKAAIYVREHGSRGHGEWSTDRDHVKTPEKATDNVADSKTPGETYQVLKPSTYNLQIVLKKGETESPEFGYPDGAHDFSTNAKQDCVIENDRNKLLRFDDGPSHTTGHMEKPRKSFRYLSDGKQEVVIDVTFRR